MNNKQQKKRTITLKNKFGLYLLSGLTTFIIYEKIGFEDEFYESLVAGNQAFWKYFEFLDDITLFPNTDKENPKTPPNNPFNPFKKKEQDIIAKEKEKEEQEEKDRQDRIARDREGGGRGGNRPNPADYEDEEKPDYEAGKDYPEYRYR